MCHLPCHMYLFKNEDVTEDAKKINGILRFRYTLNVIGFFVMHHAWLLNSDFLIIFGRIFLGWNYQQKTNFVYEVASTFVKKTMKIAGTVFP